MLIVLNAGFPDLGPPDESEVARVTLLKLEGPCVSTRILSR